MATKQPWLPQLRLGLTRNCEYFIAKQSASRVIEYIATNRHKSHIIPKEINNLCIQFYQIKGISFNMSMISKLIKDVESKQLHLSEIEAEN